MPDKKIARKVDWIICKDISSTRERAKLDELLAVLDVELKEFSPSENGDDMCMINVVGQEHVIEGLKLILKPGITF
ncbi:MAG: hypothetical protein NT116_04445 [Candidatus Parcubacteria bacterium]|nr:hypothetical protein [Candidatus Parcubacteria bacterium]